MCVCVCVCENCVHGVGKKLCVRGGGVDGWVFAHVHDFCRQSTGYSLTKCEKCVVFFACVGAYMCTKARARIHRESYSQVRGQCECAYVCLCKKQEHIQVENWTHVCMAEPGLERAELLQSPLAQR